ncbi:MAG TPA: class D sortase [Gemmatimonadaceae bacterium]|nr:class D sortase [Gemmatimonadaceae bacterium]
MRRQLGLALCVSGGLILSATGGRYAFGAYRADQARTAWDESQAHSAVASARSAALNRGPREMLVAGAPMAHIIIPRIGLDAIVLEGVSDDELNAGPGHLPGSAYPGEPGNAVISAHRDRHFNHLDALAIGDTVVTESDSRVTTWRIVARRVIDKNDPALFRTPDATLTLTTCWPIRYFGPAPERLILTAKPLHRSQPQS